MNIRCWGKDAGRLMLSSTDERLLRLTKGRRRSTCLVCDRTIANKSYALGSGYLKVCLNCHEEFLKKLTNSLEDYKNEVKALIEEIKSKDKMIMKTNILARVEDNETN